MTDSIEPLRQLYVRFCQLAQMDAEDLRFQKHLSRYFYDLVQEGFSCADMELVVRYVQAQNKKASPEYRRKIVPSKILGDLERFCEDLAEAKRLQALRVGPRQQAVDSFRGYKAQAGLQDTSRTVRDILKAAL